MERGIDVSHWQGEINWSKVKGAGIEFVIIKAGGSDSGFYTDSTFEQNYAGAKAVGINVGAYYIVGKNFTSAEAGTADAKRFLDIIKGKQFEYPVCLDLELTSPEDKIGATEASVAFCETMENAGYWVTIYASDISGFKNRLDISKLTAYDKWVARYGSKPSYVTEYGMWQSSSSGVIDGITANTVDTDESYKDYPALIKDSGLNGFTKVAEQPVVEAPKKSIDEIAKEVVRGDWGNGQERKDRLTAAGYDYSSVQNKVNEILGGKATVNEPSKSIDEIAKEVIRGNWGNGSERKERLIAAGYDYSAIQKRVNELL